MYSIHLADVSTFTARGAKAWADMMAMQKDDQSPILAAKAGLVLSEEAAKAGVDDGTWAWADITGWQDERSA